MDIVSIIVDVIIVILFAVLGYLSLKVCRENVALRKDLIIVLRYIPDVHTAEYEYLIKKYDIKR